MAWTIPTGRQSVNHRHILVNGRMVDTPNYRCKPLDIIMMKDEQKFITQNSRDFSHHEEFFQTI